MKKKHCYYLCKVEDPSFDEVDAFKDYLGTPDIKNLKIKFFDVMPTYKESYTKDFRDPDVLKYKKLSKLIEDFIFAADYPGFTKDDILDEFFQSIQDESDEKTHVHTRLGELLCGYYFILRYDDRTDRFSLVNKEDITRLFKQILNRCCENHIDAAISDATLYDEYLVTTSVNEPTINDFFNRVERQTGESYSTLSIFSPDYYYDLRIFSSPPASEELPDMTQRDTGYYYERGYEQTFGILYHELMMNEHPTPMIQRVTRTDDNGEPTGVYEVYAFVGHVDEEGDVMYSQLTAQEVFESFTKDHRDGSPIKPSENDIYRGAEPDDIICGFDMV